MIEQIVEQRLARTAQVEQEYELNLANNEQFEAYSALCREIGENESIVAIAWTLMNPARGGTANAAPPLFTNFSDLDIKAHRFFLASVVVASPIRDSD